MSDYKPELAGPTGKASFSVTCPGEQFWWSLLYPGRIDWGTVIVCEWSGDENNQYTAVLKEH